VARSGFVAGLTNFAAKLGQLPLKHQPGDAFTYSVNHDVLGALIERGSTLRRVSGGLLSIQSRTGIKVSFALNNGIGSQPNGTNSHPRCSVSLSALI
jgi:hypothetical protein